MKTPKPITAFCAVASDGTLLFRTIRQERGDAWFELTERVIHKSTFWARENGYRIVKVEIKVREK